MKWQSKLPKGPPVKNMLRGIMVRPNEKICKWLSDEASKRGCSANKIVVAILEAAYEGEK